MLDRNDDRPRPFTLKSEENLFKGQIMSVKMFEYQKVWWTQTPSTTIPWNIGRKSQFSEKSGVTATHRTHLVFGANYQTPNEVNKYMWCSLFKPLLVLSTAICQRRHFSNGGRVLICRHAHTAAHRTAAQSRLTCFSSLSSHLGKINAKNPFCS